jgi:hypothetical protein
VELPDVPLHELDRVTRSVIDGRWHLVSSSDGREELFDLAADPTETTNVVAEHLDVRDRLRALLPVLD